jgi:hypothetical protein
MQKEEYEYGDTQYCLYNLVAVFHEKLVKMMNKICCKLRHLGKNTALKQVWTEEKKAAVYHCCL